MTLKTPVFSGKLQIFANQPFIIILKNGGDMAETELVNSGVGVGTVRRLLGHRNLQTTQRYAELSGRAGYNYASSSTVRHELDAFARRKTRTR